MKRAYARICPGTCRSFNSKSARFRLLSNITSNDETVVMQRSIMVFVLEGQLVVSQNEFKDRVVSKGEMCLLLKNGVVTGRVTTPDTVLLCCALKPHFHFCKEFKIDDLLTTFPIDFSYDFNLLPIHERLFDYLKLISMCIKDNMRCAHSYDLAEQQLHLFLRYYYSESQLVSFFYPFLGDDFSFKFLVLSQLDQVSRVEELASLAHMSLSTFTRKFKEVFNEAPYEWITKRKAERVYRDLLVSSKSYMEIVDDYNFSSQAYLITFCKKHFGKTPQEIRQETGR